MDYARIRQRREGSLSVLAPTDKTLSDESHLGTSGSPPPFRSKEGDYKVPQKDSLK